MNIWQILYAQMFAEKKYIILVYNNLYLIASKEHPWEFEDFHL